MSAPRQLSKRERQITDAIYAHGEATVSQVSDGMPPRAQITRALPLFPGAMP